MNLFLQIFFVLFAITLIQSKPIDGLRVSGKYIVNSLNQLVVLRGSSRSGTEYACVQGNGIFDGPADINVLNAMKSWGFNVVRIPLNEQCWLGINGVDSRYSGANYRNAIKNWVDLIYSKDMAVILELHWANAGTGWASYLTPMPNKDHSITFWTQVATAYKDRSYVIFEPYNEPFPDNNNWDSTEGWRCWRDGGSCNGISYQVAGMQSLVHAIRNTTATNIIGLGGIAYSNSLSRWLEYKPTDSLNQLVAIWHSYSNNICNNQNCWNQYITPVANSVPILATEIGQYDCQNNYINNVMTYLDSIKQNYLAWTWNVWNCGSGPALIADESGTPTNFGIGYKNHINGQTASFPPVPTTTTTGTTQPPSTTTGGTPAPSTTTTTTGGSSSTSYSFTWCTCNNDFWTQLTINPAPTSPVTIDCGYGNRATTSPYGPNIFILGNTGTSCNTNKVAVVTIGNKRYASKTDGSSINTFSPSTVTYSLSWCTCNNDYWTQVTINPAPSSPVFIDCGYGAYPTTTPYGPNIFILGNTNRQCKTDKTVTVYIGSTVISSKTDGSGVNSGRSLSSNGSTTTKANDKDSTVAYILIAVIGSVALVAIIIASVLVVRAYRKSSNSDYVPLNEQK